MTKLNTVKETIDATIIESLGISNKKELDPSDTLLEGLGADSLDMVEITMLIEENLDVTIPDAAIDDWITVQDLTEYVEKLVESK